MEDIQNKLVWVNVDDDWSIAEVLKYTDKKKKKVQACLLTENTVVPESATSPRSSTGKKVEIGFDKTLDFGLLDLSSRFQFDSEREILRVATQIFCQRNGTIIGKFSPPSALTNETIIRSRFGFCFFADVDDFKKGDIILSIDGCDPNQGSAGKAFLEAAKALGIGLKSSKVLIQAVRLEDSYLVALLASFQHKNLLPDVTDKDGLQFDDRQFPQTVYIANFDGTVFVKTALVGYNSDDFDIEGDGDDSNMVSMVLGLTEEGNQVWVDLAEWPWSMSEVEAEPVAKKASKSIKKGTSKKAPPKKIAAVPASAKRKREDYDDDDDDDLFSEGEVAEMDADPDDDLLDSESGDDGYEKPKSNKRNKSKGSKSSSSADKSRGRPKGASPKIGTIKASSVEPVPKQQIYQEEIFIWEFQVEKVLAIRFKPQLATKEGEDMKEGGDASDEVVSTGRDCLLKFKNQSYRAISWEDENDVLTDSSGKVALKYFLMGKKRRGEQEEIDEDFTLDTIVNPEWTEVDRIFASKMEEVQHVVEEEVDDEDDEEYEEMDDEDTQENGEEASAEKKTKKKVKAKKTITRTSSSIEPMYLVKWRGLGYSQASWEFAHELSEEDEASKLQHFLSMQKRVQEEQRRLTSALRGGRGDPKHLSSPKGAGGSSGGDNRSIFLSLQREKFSQETIPVTGVELRDSQIIGINWLMFQWSQRRSCILADEMGLGKTIQSLSFLQILRTKCNCKKPFLVVVPLSTVRHWQMEIEEHSDATAVVMYGDERDRDSIKQHEFTFLSKEVIIPHFDILITTYEVANIEASFLKKLEWDALVVDEAHKLKNDKNLVRASLAAVTTDFKLLLTGTPIQNDMHELFSLLQFMQPADFPSKEAFMIKYGQVTTEGQVLEIQTLLQKYMLRREKKDVEASLPKKTETVVDVELTLNQKQYYRAILERNRKFLTRGPNKKQPQLINILMELRKVCNHPFLVQGAQGTILDEHDAKEAEAAAAGTSTAEDDTPDDPGLNDPLVYSSGKMVLLHKLLPKLKAEKSKTLIFSQFKIMLDILQTYLEKYGYGYERIDGSVVHSQRSTSIKRFNEEDSPSLVFLLSTRAGGVGINLQAANTVILFDIDWNPQSDLQAIARSHRLGQKKAVTVYRFLTRHTAEADLFNTANKKLGLTNVLLKGLNKDGKEEKSKSSRMDARSVEDELRFGAYQILQEDEAEAQSSYRNFIRDDIEHILQARSKEVVYTEAEAEQEQESSVFSKVTFITSKADTGLKLDDADFWERALPKEFSRIGRLKLLFQGDAIASLQASSSLMARTIKKVMEIAREINDQRQSGEQSDELDEILDLLEVVTASGLYPDRDAELKGYMQSIAKPKRHRIIRQMSYAEAFVMEDTGSSSRKSSGGGGKDGLGYGSDDEFHPAGEEPAFEGELEEVVQKGYKERKKAAYERVARVMGLTPNPDFPTWDPNAVVEVEAEAEDAVEGSEGMLAGKQSSSSPSQQFAQQHSQQQSREYRGKGLDAYANVRTSQQLRELNMAETAKKFPGSLTQQQLALVNQIQLLEKNLMSKKQQLVDCRANEKRGDQQLLLDRKEQARKRRDEFMAKEAQLKGTKETVLRRFQELWKRKQTSGITITEEGLMQQCKDSFAHLDDQLRECDTKLKDINALIKDDTARLVMMGIDENKKAQLEHDVAKIDRTLRQLRQVWEVEKRHIQQQGHLVAGQQPPQQHFTWKNDPIHYFSRASMLMLQKQYPDMGEDQLMRHLPAKFESLSGSSKAFWKARADAVNTHIFKQMQSGAHPDIKSILEKEARLGAAVLERDAKQGKLQDSSAAIFTAAYSYAALSAAGNIDAGESSWIWKMIEEMRQELTLANQPEEVVRQQRELKNNRYIHLLFNLQKSVMSLLLKNKEDPDSVESETMTPSVEASKRQEVPSTATALSSRSDSSADGAGVIMTVEKTDNAVEEDGAVPADGTLNATAQDSSQGASEQASATSLAAAAATVTIESEEDSAEVGTAGPKVEEDGAESAAPASDPVDAAIVSDSAVATAPSTTGDGSDATGSAYSEAPAPDSLKQEQEDGNSSSGKMEEDVEIVADSRAGAESEGADQAPRGFGKLVNVVAQRFVRALQMSQRVQVIPQPNSNDGNKFIAKLWVQVFDPSLLHFTLSGGNILCSGKDFPLKGLEGICFGLVDVVLYAVNGLPLTGMRVEQVVHTFSRMSPPYVLLIGQPFRSREVALQEILNQIEYIVRMSFKVEEIVAKTPPEEEEALSAPAQPSPPPPKRTIVDLVRRVATESPRALLDILMKLQIMKMDQMLQAAAAPKVSDQAVAVASAIAVKNEPASDPEPKGDEGEAASSEEATSRMEVTEGEAQESKEAAAAAAAGGEDAGAAAALKATTEVEKKAEEEEEVDPAVLDAVAQLMLNVVFSLKEVSIQGGNTGPATLVLAASLDELKDLKFQQTPEGVTTCSSRTKPHTGLRGLALHLQDQTVLAVNGVKLDGLSLNGVQLTLQQDCQAPYNFVFNQTFPSRHLAREKILATVKEILSTTLPVLDAQLNAKFPLLPDQHSSAPQHQQGRQTYSDPYQQQAEYRTGSVAYGPDQAPGQGYRPYPAGNGASGFGAASSSGWTGYTGGDYYGGPGGPQVGGPYGGNLGPFTGAPSAPPGQGPDGQQMVLVPRDMLQKMSANYGWSGGQQQQPMPFGATSAAPHQGYGAPAGYTYEQPHHQNPNYPHHQAPSGSYHHPGHQQQQQQQQQQLGSYIATPYDPYAQSQYQPPPQQPTHSQAPYRQHYPPQPQPMTMQSYVQTQDSSVGPGRQHFDNYRF